LLFKRRDQQHAARRASEAELAMRSSPSDMCQTAINRDDAERLQTLLSSLTDSQQQVITLAFYGQLTHAEIAAQLGTARRNAQGPAATRPANLRRSSRQSVA